MLMAAEGEDSVSTLEPAAKAPEKDPSASVANRR
jgi:hypothetical protein